MQMEEDLICAICVHDYRDPVKLPCGHTYCRECLSRFVERCKPSSTDGETNSQDQGICIACPVCRAPTCLEAKFLASLHRCIDKDNKDVHVCGKQGPECSMCADDPKASAVKFCLTCRALYCEGCLESMHPMRGPLRRHKLIGVEEYTPQEAGDEDDEPIKAEKNVDKCEPEDVRCDKHLEKLTIYCVTCHHVICIQCLPGHSLHQMTDIDSAFETLKKPLLDKAEVCRKLISEAERCSADTTALQDKVKVKENCHLGQVERTYNRKLEELTSWRRTLVDSVKQRHGDWSAECDVRGKELRSRIAETQPFLAASSELLASSKTRALKHSSELMSRFDDQMQVLKTTVDQQKKENQSCRVSMDSDPVKPLDVTHPKLAAVMATPALKFTTRDDVKLMVERDSSVVTPVCSEGSWDLSTAWTDGHFQKGEHYWELTFSVSSVAPSDSWKVFTGVGQRNQQGNRVTPTSSWGISVESNPRTMVTVCKRINRSYNVAIWVHFLGKGIWQFGRLGFYLNCEHGTLAIVDCTENQIISVIHCKGIDQSLPLIPVVQLEGYPDISVRLESCEVSNIPQAIARLLG